jgi:hypothetical protein
MSCEQVDNSMKNENNPDQLLDKVWEIQKKIKRKRLENL